MKVGITTKEGRTTVLDMSEAGAYNIYADFDALRRKKKLSSLFKKQHPKPGRMLIIKTQDPVPLFMCCWDDVRCVFTMNEDAPEVEPKEETKPKKRLTKIKE